MVIVVEIEDRCAEKPFLGGWRNVVTGTEYHDAHTQTCPRDPRVRRSSKEDPPGGCALEDAAGVPRRTANVITQTRWREVASCCKYTSVSTERATQTSRLPDLRDKLVTPLAGAEHGRRERGLRHEEDKEKRFSRVRSSEDEAAVKIQRYFRAYRARVELGALAKLSRETRALTPPEPERIYHLRHCRKTQFQILGASTPTTRADFEMLQNVLGRWRATETSRIDRTLFGPSKLAARMTVLLKEIELLRSIEAIKTRVRLERRQRSYLDHLDRLGRPEIWRTGNGTKIQVDTLRAQRARECRHFYATLLPDDSTRAERIRVVTELRNYVEKHTCSLANHLLSLLDQELELLGRHHLEPSVLQPLRNRSRLALLRLSLSFCQPSPNSRKNIESGSKSRLCNRCGKFLKLDQLPSCTSPSGFVTCHKCTALRPSKDPKVVYEPYELMLRDLRSREATLDPSNRTLAFAVDSRVIYRLVNYVWHGKSGISECDDLFRLTLVRFRPERDWAPWNSLLLTKREAALHQTVPDPWQIYAPRLVKKFVVKNLQAKLRFDFIANLKLLG